MRANPVAVVLRGARISVRAADPYELATYGIGLLGVLTSLVTLDLNPMWTLFVAALLFGWSEVDGLCGTSHVCALTPLRVLGAHERLWCKAVSAYTVGGLLTATCIGALLGLIGLVVTSTGGTRFLLVALLALVLAARELGSIQFRLPQVPRQTNKMWAFQFDFVTAAAMWGVHIGLGFATVVAHGGFFVVVASAIALGPTLGASLMATYWLGRTLPIWIAPALTSDAGNASHLADLVLKRPAAYRHIAAAGLLCAAAALLALIGSS